MNIEPHRPDGFGCSHVLSAFFAANSLNHTGSALLGSIVSGFVVVLSLAYLGMAVTGSSRVGKDTRQLLLAEAYSAELL